MRFPYLVALASLAWQAAKFSLRLFLEVLRALLVVTIVLVCGVLIILGWSQRLLTLVIELGWRRS